MKYIKTYEENWNKEIGYYVVVRSKIFNGKEDIMIFLENNVGKITKMFYPGAWFKLSFDNAPIYLEKFIYNYNFNTNDIEFISKDKKEAEEYLKIKNNINKYNL